jgi:3-hydroxyisobutyrate dehydrogenase-like beta-hydroxyacid dehydrogenase
VSALYSNVGFASLIAKPVPGVDPNAPASKDYAPGFKVQFMRKDYNLAIEAAETSNSKLYLGASGLQVYTDASLDERCVDKDSRVVFRFIGGNETWQETTARQ